MVGQGLIPGMLTVDPEETTPLATSSYNWLTNKNVRLQEEITKMLPPPSWSGPRGQAGTRRWKSHSCSTIEEAERGGILGVQTFSLKGKVGLVGTPVNSRHEVGHDV